MKVNTLIIGTGFLSKNLKKKISNSKNYSAKITLKKINLINKNKKKINLIINSFYSSKKLINIKSYEIFVKKTVFEIAKILDKLAPSKINKIIYTSSSSVYGDLINRTNFTDDFNRNIYASFKNASESLIKNYSNKNLIPFYICRVFNIYGNKNEFSIIEKLINSKKNNDKIQIYNNGSSVRDFIHVDDVVKIYIKILKRKLNPGVYDIGTGKGLSIIELVKKLKFQKKNLIFKEKTINEVDFSIANTKTLLKENINLKFKKVENYLKLKDLSKYNKK